MKSKVIRIPDYIPSPKQAVFHRSSAYETLFGGAAGPGKTAALAAEAITSANENAETYVYIFRLTLPEIMLSIHMELVRQMTAYNNAVDNKNKITFNGSSHTWKFPNGSFIQYAFCQYDADMYRYQSAEIHVLLVDELTHFKQEWYEYFKTRVRSGRPRDLRVMACSNPGNIGHGWVKKYFVDKGDQVIYTDPSNGRTRQFIKAIIDDHPDENFRKNYILTLEAIKNERLKKALRWGDWNTFEGQVFMEWDERTHVIDSLPTWINNEGISESILNYSERYIGYDQGRRDPGCAIWIIYAPENEYGVRHYYAYREFYQQWKDAKMWAEDISFVIKDEPIEYMVLPHDCFAMGSGTARTIADTFSDFDIPYLRANSLSHSARMHRQDLLHQLLSISPDGKPYLMVHKNCSNLIRTIPDLPYSETQREAISDKSEDHAYDALTYGLMVIDDSEAWVYTSTPREEKNGWDEYGPYNDIQEAITPKKGRGY